MNEEKVNRSKKERIDFKLAEQFPVVQGQYQELLSFCQTAATSEPMRSQYG